MIESQEENPELSQSEPTVQGQEKTGRQPDLSAFHLSQPSTRQCKPDSETEGVASNSAATAKIEETVQQTPRDSTTTNPAEIAVPSEEAEAHISALSAPADGAASNGMTAPVVTNELVMAKARSLWRVIDPKDPNDPVKHQDTALVEGRNGYRIIGASRRGRSHAHDGKYREDSMQVLALGEWLLVAVADGAGSRPLARVGASLATSESKRYLYAHLRHLPPGGDIKKQLRATLVGAMISSLGSVTVEAVRRGCDPDDMASTLILLAFYTAPGSELLGIAQIGDGGIALALADGSETLLGQADHGAFGGESLFLTSRETQGTWHQRVTLFDLSKSDRLLMLLVGTDGVLDDFTPPFGQLRDLVAEVASPLIAERPEQNLCDWLDYERRSSFDDRTLIAIVQFKPTQTGQAK